MQNRGVSKNNKCGIKNIIEFDSVGIIHNEIEYKSFIFKDVSMDDAFITISTNEFIVAHGNDNWQKLPNNVLNIIKKDFAKYSKSNRLFMSQTNMADGYPLIYTNFSEEEKNKKVKERQDNMILTSIKNAIDIESGAFISYAGMALPFIKGQEHLLNDAYCKSIDYINQLLKINNIDTDIVLDMIPGDSYDFKKIDKLFGKQYYNHNDIKDSTIDFYRKYNWDKNCNTYQNVMHIGDTEKTRLLNLFMDNFKLFVNNKFKKTNKFQKDIFNTKLTFKDGIIEKTISFSENASIHVTMLFDIIPLDKILIGELNWEVSHVGYESRVHINGDYHIGALIRYLTMYGYVYQQQIYLKNN